MEKTQIIEAIIRKLEAELGPMLQAAESSREAATHEESRAEDSHDTRGLEASYLAGAQAGRAADLKHLISMFRLMTTRSFKPTDPIDLGAVIELEQNGRRSFYFLVQAGGGISVQVAGKTVNLLAPKALISEELFGKRSGDSFEVEVQGGTREYEVIQVF